MTNRECWKILIVDDEEEIHQVTELALDSLKFNELPIFCLHAYSAEEAKDLLSSEFDIAVILLDVVMETETAGLDLVKWIREDVLLSSIRIILRTGQPGAAPQMEVIKEYDINDYKEKTELTSGKLTTVVISSIRSYAQLSEIERHKSDLEKIIRGTSSLFEVFTLEKLTKNILNQFNRLLQVDKNLLQHSFSGISLEKNRSGMFVLGTVGDYNTSRKLTFPDDFSDDEIHIINEVIETRQSKLNGNYIATYFVTHNDREGIMLLKCNSQLPDINLDIITLFSLHVSVAFDNLQLNMEIRETRQDIMDKVWQVIETRLIFNKGHVSRVFRIASYIGMLLELPDQEYEILKLASSFHDIGLVGLSDELLHKPYPLSEEDHQIFMQHTAIGHSLLKNSKRKAITAAAMVSLQHHESYDGTGYPGKHSGKDIDYFARIVRIADVIDFYGKNYSNEEWTEEGLCAFLKQESGKMFDPDIIDSIIDHVDILYKLKGSREEAR